MRKYSKICAAAMAISMLATAAPASYVFAAEGDSEEVVMNATITMNGTSAVASGENVTVDGGKITISASGAYEFKGTLENGQICVNVPDETADAGTVKLYFNGISITGQSEAPVYIANAENTSINLVADTENFLYDGETYTETQGTIYAKDDLTIKGDGKLRIEATYQYGILCNNDLKINGGNIKVKTEADDGIRAKSSVTIKDGKVDVNAEGDGIKSTKGDVSISGGKVEVKAGNDAIQAETEIVISEGKVEAGGDRGLRCDEGTISISGGRVLATATDNQVENLTATQPVLLTSYAEEYSKGLSFELLNVADSASVFSLDTTKKFSYALFSSNEMQVGSKYKVDISDTELNTKYTMKDVDSIQLTDMITTYASPITLVASVEDPEVNYDINDDGKTSIADAVLLARYVGEESGLNITSVGISRTDCNRDGVATMNDVSKLLRVIARLEN